VDNTGGSSRAVQPGTDGGSTTGKFQGLPLVDLLQVWSLNHFSGMVRVTSKGRAGHLYFVDGEIVHAEAEGASGEGAVRAIIAWADPAFEPFPNTSTLKRTIQKRLSHLLLDAHREFDERRRTGEPPAPTTAQAPAQEAPRPSVMDQIRAIRGVTGIARFGQDGRPSGSDGPDAQALAAKGLYLALNHAAAVARAFGLRDLVLAAVEGVGDSFILIHAQGRYLGVAIQAGAAAEPIAAQIRALLSRPVAR